MNMKNFFFLCAISIGLFSHHKAHTLSDGYQFAGLCFVTVAGGGVLWWSGAAPKIAEAALPQILGGAATASTMPLASLIAKIGKKPFNNPIDRLIKEHEEKRKIISDKHNSLLQLTQSRTLSESQKSELDILLQSTAQQLLATEKKITKLYEKKEFDKNRPSVLN